MSADRLTPAEVRQLIALLDKLHRRLSDDMWADRRHRIDDALETVKEIYPCACSQ